MHSLKSFCFSLTTCVHCLRQKKKSNPLCKDVVYQTGCFSLSLHRQWKSLVLAKFAFTVGQGRIQTIGRQYRFSNQSSSGEMDHRKDPCFLSEKKCNACSPRLKLVCLLICETRISVTSSCQCYVFCKVLFDSFLIKKG